MIIKKIYNAPRVEILDYKVQNVLKVASKLPGGMLPPRRADGMPIS